MSCAYCQSKETASRPKRNSHRCKKCRKGFSIRVQGVRWFTNLKHERLHEKTPLITETAIIKFSTKKPLQRYDN